MVVFDLAFISMGAIPRATQLRTSVPNAAQHDLESYSGPGGSEVQILSPRPFVSKTCIQFLVFRLRRCAVKRARIDGVTRHASSREFAVISLGDGRSCVAAGPSEWPNIGECRVSSTLPLRSYIWAPHGRQGSKLRTTRIMSIPLILSGPFSSKIGVFWTASS
jgi:hypothetical protein